LSPLVFTKIKNGNIFYDQSLFTIEKGRLIDVLKQKNKLEAVNPQQNGWDSSKLYEENMNPFDYYDKRLINICQVPQAPFLDENLEPRKEIVGRVRRGETLNNYYRSQNHMN
jgi:hypothetical protein